MPPLKHILRYVASLVLMGLFLHWAFEGLELSSVWMAIVATPPMWIASLVLTTMVTVALRAWRWRVLMRPFAPEVSLWDASLALLICYSANIVIPRSGEALRAISLKWTRGTNIGSVLATVVVERVLDVMFLVLLMAMSLVVIPGRIEAAFPLLAPLSLVALIGCLGLLGFLVLVSRNKDAATRVVEKLLGRISKRLSELVARLLETFVRGLAALNTPAAYLEIGIASIFLNAGYLLLIYQSFVAFGFEQAPLDLGAAASLVVLAISSFGMVIPTPGGVGTYHFFFGESLHLLFAVPATAALACATVLHAVATVTYLSLGGPAFLLQRARARRRGAGREQ